MTTTELGLIAIFAYAMAFLCRVAASPKFSWRFLLFVLTWVALFAQGVQLHHWIDLPMGQNLSWVNLLALLFWLIALIVAIVDYLLPVGSLALLIYPFSIIMIGLGQMVHPVHLIVTRHYPAALIHILLAVLSVAFLVICGIQALLLVAQQFALKQKRFLSLLQFLPPLQVMEQLLFLEISLSALCLTFFFILTILTFHLSVFLLFWPETLLSLVLWGIFCILLLGRYVFRWRSATAAIWVSVAVAVGLALYLMGHLR